MANERGYVVGRGKPPVHSRFRKGQSGNPSGRSKGSKNAATRIRELLDGKIPVIENDKRKNISLLDAIFKQLVKKALSGDYRAITLLLQLTDNDPTLAKDEKTTAELQAEGARNLDLFYNAVKILVDLGVPLPQITRGQPMNNSIDTESISDQAENDAIEITSTPIEDAPPSAGSLPARLGSPKSNVSSEHDE